MNIIYTVLAAVVGMALVVIVDMTITRIFDEKVFSKNYIKKPLSIQYHKNFKFRSDIND